jgi:hypothetical protein
MTANGQELAAGEGLVMFINSSSVHFQVLLFVRSYTPICGSSVAFGELALLGLRLRAQRS